MGSLTCLWRVLSKNGMSSKDLLSYWNLRVTVFLNQKSTPTNEVSINNLSVTSKLPYFFWLRKEVMSLRWRKRPHFFFFRSQLSTARKHGNSLTVQASSYFWHAGQEGGGGKQVCWSDATIPPFLFRRSPYKCIAKFQHSPLKRFFEDNYLNSFGTRRFELFQGVLVYFHNIAVRW